MCRGGCTGELLGQKGFLEWWGLVVTFPPDLLAPVAAAAGLEGSGALWEVVLNPEPCGAAASRSSMFTQHASVQL